MARRRYQNEPRGGGSSPQPGLQDIMQLMSFLSPQADMEAQLAQQKLSDAMAASAYAAQQGYPSLEAMMSDRGFQLKDREFNNQITMSDQDFQGRQLLANAQVEQQKLANQPGGQDIPGLMMMLQQAASTGDTATMQALAAYSPDIVAPFLDQMGQQQALQQEAFAASMAGGSGAQPSSAMQLGQSVAGAVDTVGNLVQGQMPQVPQQMANTGVDFLQGVFPQVGANRDLMQQTLMNAPETLQTLFLPSGNPMDLLPQILGMKPQPTARTPEEQLTPTVAGFNMGGGVFSRMNR